MLLGLPQAGTLAANANGQHRRSAQLQAAMVRAEKIAWIRIAPKRARSVGQWQSNWRHWRLPLQAKEEAHSRRRHAVAVRAATGGSPSASSGGASAGGPAAAGGGKAEASPFVSDATLRNLSPEARLVFREVRERHSGGAAALPCPDASLARPGCRLTPAAAPPSPRLFTSAPARSSAEMAARCPPSTARCSGVQASWRGGAGRARGETGKRRG